MKTIKFREYDEDLELKITAGQERNLRRLAAYLDALPNNYVHFDMQFFIHTEDGEGGGHQDAVNGAAYHVKECGTVACACGHGPAAGVKPKREETWADYPLRAFGMVGEPFEWCFGYRWSESDNTPRGAAQRITLMLDTAALPEDQKEQRRGEAVRSYGLLIVPTLKTLGL